MSRVSATLKSINQGRSVQKYERVVEGLAAGGQLVDVADEDDAVLHRNTEKCDRCAAAAGATWLTLRPNEVGDSWGQRLILTVAEASEGGLAAWSGQIGAIHSWRSLYRLNRVGHPGTMAV